MNPVKLLATFVLACAAMYAGAVPGHIEIVDYSSVLSLKRGKLLEARFVSGKGPLDIAGSYVYYEYIERGRTEFVQTVGSLSGLSLVLTRELSAPINATALESHVPDLMRTAFFSARVQVQVLDRAYVRALKGAANTERYTVEYLQQECLDPEAIIVDNDWRLKFRLIDETEGARVEEWEMSGKVAPFCISQADIRLLPTDERLKVSPHL